MKPSASASRRSGTASRRLRGSVEGTPVSANIVLSLEVLAGTFDGRHPKFGPRTVQVQCTVLNNELTLKTTGTGANFDIQVTCAVTDGSIVGNLKTNVIATPAISVGFVGAELTDDPDYKRQRDACNKALSDLFKKAGAREVPEGKGWRSGRVRARHSQRLAGLCTPAGIR